MVTKLLDEMIQVYISIHGEEPKFIQINHYVALQYYREIKSFLETEEIRQSEYKGIELRVSPLTSFIVLG